VACPHEIHDRSPGCDARWACRWDGDHHGRDGRAARDPTTNCNIRQSAPTSGRVAMRAAGRGAPRARRAGGAVALGGVRAAARGGRWPGGAQAGGGRSEAALSRPRTRTRTPTLPERAGRIGRTGDRGERRGRSLRLNFGSSRGGHVRLRDRQDASRPTYKRASMRRNGRSSRPLVPGPECSDRDRLHTLEPQRPDRRRMGAGRRA